MTIELVLSVHPVCWMANCVKLIRVWHHIALFCFLLPSAVSVRLLMLPVPHMFHTCPAGLWISYIHHADDDF